MKNWPVFLNRSIFLTPEVGLVEAHNTNIWDQYEVRILACRVGQSSKYPIPCAISLHTQVTLLRCAIEKR